MKLTKRQKILACLFALAALAFVFDRVMSGLNPFGPDEVSASVVGQEPAMSCPNPAASLPPLPKGEAQQKKVLADRLASLGEDALDENGPVRDAFCPPKDWLGSAPVTEAPPNSAEVRARAFFAAHKLSATVLGADGDMAIVDGKCLAVGRSLEGFRLLSVDRSSAVFEGEGVRVRLVLPEDGVKDQR